MGELNWFDFFLIEHFEHSKYIKFNEVAREVYNREFEKIIYEIGSNNFKKGIKKIISYCKTNFNMNISAREVKTLLRTQKRKLKYSDNKLSNVLFCPKSICHISQSVFQLYPDHALQFYSSLHPEYYNYLIQILHVYQNRYNCNEIRTITDCLGS